MVRVGLNRPHNRRLTRPQRCVTNLAFYERFGFALERELQLIPDGPPHWAMRRPAAGGPTDGTDPGRGGRDTDEPGVRS